MGLAPAAPSAGRPEEVPGTTLRLGSLMRTRPGTLALPLRLSLDVPIPLLALWAALSLTLALALSLPLTLAVPVRTMGMLAAVPLT